MEFTLLFAVLTAVVFMLIAARLFSNRLGEIPHAVDTLVGAASVGLFAGRIGAMMLDGVNPMTNPFQIILVRAGVDTRVAATTALAVLVWTTRARVPEWMDALAPVAVAGVAGWHGGCVWRGTCLGAASDLPWAFGLPGSAVTRHPVELYAALAMVALSVVVDRLPARQWLPSGVAIGGVALVRLITEPLRPSLDGGPVWFYVTAAVVGLGAAALGRRIMRAPTG
jgi:prolipoprotein diacylglyceryltransferase